MLLSCHPYLKVRRASPYYIPLGKLLSLEPQSEALRQHPEDYTTVAIVFPKRLTTALLSRLHRFRFLLAARFLPCAAEICFGDLVPRTFRNRFFLNLSLRLRPVRGTCGLVLIRVSLVGLQLQAEAQGQAQPGEAAGQACPDVLFRVLA